MNSLSRLFRKDALTANFWISASSSTFSPEELNDWETKLEYFLELSPENDFYLLYLEFLLNPLGFELSFGISLICVRVFWPESMEALLWMPTPG